MYERSKSVLVFGSTLMFVIVLVYTFVDLTCNEKNLVYLLVYIYILGFSLNKLEPPY